VSGETHDRGLIDTNVVVHLAALEASHLPGEMVISAVTLAELSAIDYHGRLGWTKNHLSVTLSDARGEREWKPYRPTLKPFEYKTPASMPASASCSA